MYGHQRCDRGGGHPPRQSNRSRFGCGGSLLNWYGPASEGPRPRQLRDVSNHRGNVEHSSSNQRSAVTPNNHSEHSMKGAASTGPPDCHQSSSRSNSWHSTSDRRRVHSMSRSQKPNEGSTGNQRDDYNQPIPWAARHSQGLLARKRGGGKFARGNERSNVRFEPYRNRENRAITNGWRAKSSLLMKDCRSSSHCAKSSFLDVKSCRTVEELVKLASSHGVLEPKQLSAFWSMIPRLMHSKSSVNPQEQQELQEALERIRARTVDTINYFNQIELTGTVLGMAKVVIATKSSPRNQAAFQDFLSRSNDIFQSFATASIRLLPQFSARSISNFAYAFAIAKIQPVLDDGSKLFEHIAESAIARMSSFNKEFDPQDISILLWAFAKLGIVHSRLFAKAAVFLNARDLIAFGPQSLANILWSFSKTGEPNHGLFERVADAIVARDLARFKPQNISNILWSYAKAGESTPRLFKRVADAIVARDLTAFNAQDLSNILWAYTTAGLSARRLFNTVEDAISARSMSAFKPQNISNILWSYAKSGEATPRLFKKVAGVIIERGLARFEPQHLSNIIWAYATSCMYQVDLFESVADAATSRFGQFNAQNISNLLWAFASIGRVNRDLFEAAVPAAKTLIEQFTRQELAIIGWSFAVSGVSASKLFDEIFIAALMKQESDFCQMELRQLHQWQLWQRELKSRTELPPSFCAICREAFESKDARSSSLQKDVALELSALGLQPKEEAVLPDSGYSIDALVTVDGDRIGVEVDGPYHFIDRIPNGATILKRRQVARIDRIRILSVPYWEWDELKNSRAKKQDYLMEKLKASTEATTTVG